MAEFLKAKVIGNGCKAVSGQTGLVKEVKRSFTFYYHKDDYHACNYATKIITIPPLSTI